MSRHGKIIDIHSRMGLGRKYASRTAEDALREMDSANVEKAWICPPDACVAVRNRDGNDFIAGVVRSHPERFVGCAVVNPWFGEEAVGELARAFDLGLKVLFLHPPLQGFQLSDNLTEPLLKLAEQRNAPVYVHTGTPVSAEPFQLAVLARRHPRNRFIMGHMGYADFWSDAVAAAAESANIWVETSLIDGEIITAAAADVGPERILFGSAAPFSSIKVELGKIVDCGFDEDDLELILRSNAERLLRHED